MGASLVGGTRVRSVFSDGTASVVGSGVNGNGALNGAAVNLGGDAADLWDDAMTLDMVTDPEGEGDEEVSSLRLNIFLSLVRITRALVCES